ncbi:hypothetical protein DL765_004924 [Monosporascus sp. GIB2]|nr:hypothetical protein DL765_004924 [Monosporascus sp. GIB2]
MTVSLDCVTTDRGGIIENRHYVHVAVVDQTGNLLYSAGDPSRITLARSAAKPAQALAVLETGAFRQYGFDEADLALMCASHNSEARHIARARAMLAKAGVAEWHLRCGGHAALSEAVNRACIKADYAPTAVCNNCSGKHAGMLAAARALGEPLADYHLPDHPVQVRVKQVFAELAELDAKHVRWGIDGCNLPAPALALWALGRVYAALAGAADDLDAAQQAGLPVVPERTRRMASIYHAMARYPEMVGGDGRFCTELMQAFEGALIGKVGADGCYGVGIRASEKTISLGAEGSIGIAVKIEDGSVEILYAVVMEVLAQLGIGTLDTREKLTQFHHLKRLNTMGVTTGRVSLGFKGPRHQFVVASPSRLEPTPKLTARGRGITQASSSMIGRVYKKSGTPEPIPEYPANLRGKSELDNLNVASLNAASEQPVSLRNSHEDAPRQDFSLPPVDSGKDAWLFLAACWLIEALIHDETREDLTDGISGFGFSFGIFQDYYSSYEPFLGAGNIAVIGTSTMVMQAALVHPGDGLCINYLTR